MIQVKRLEQRKGSGQRRQYLSDPRRSGARQDVHALRRREALRRQRAVAVDLHVPAVLSGGLAMTPLPEMLMSTDVRYIFYENTPGFKVDGDDAGGVERHDDVADRAFCSCCQR